MKTIWVCILYCCLCFSTNAQTPLAIKDSADKLMSDLHFDRAIPAYKNFILKAGKEPKRWLPFIYAAYDSIYIAATLVGKYEDIARAMQDAFEIARKYDGTSAINERLASLTSFYRSALKNDYNLPYQAIPGLQRELVLVITSVKKLIVEV